jgi:hypothetical protein
MWLSLEAALRREADDDGPGLISWPAKFRAGSSKAKSREYITGN